MKYSRKKIEDFFEGKLSRKEAEEFLQWFTSPEGKQEYENLIGKVWKSETEKSDDDPKEELPKADQPVPDRPAPLLKTQKNIKSGKRLERSFLLRFAAALLAILSLTYLYFSYQPESSENLKAQIEENNTIIKTAQKGQRLKLSLPDGSMVYLNAGTTISYRENFTEDRTLHLIGEAFFEVKENKEKPFKVLSNNISTTALGTSFNINAYQNAPHIEVSLVSGKILVEEMESKQEIKVDPGQAITYSSLENVLQKQNIDITKVLRWKEGILHFNKTPFHEVIPELERWYGVEIQVRGTQKIPSTNCSVTFQPNEYLSNVLEVLGHSLEFEYAISDKNVVLQF